MSSSLARTSLIVGSILLIGVIAALARSQKSVTDADAPLLVYICRDSKEIFFSALPLDELINPSTGRASLSPAVHCLECRIWQPAPPAERMYGNPQGMLCPKCKSPRSFTGELPADAIEL